jgi:hypothetical protein
MKELEKEFVPPAESVELKKIGFDEPCFAYYDMAQQFEFPGCIMYNSSFIELEAAMSPTYSQAFRFFREKYNLFGKVYIINFGADEYSFDIYDLYEEKYKYENFIGAGASYTGTFDTYEKAELACLRKLIEIVKENK